MGLEKTIHSDPILTGPPQAILYRSQPWYDAYMATLFEADKDRLEERIRGAERLILSRERELVASRTGNDEQRALNNALHALHALRTCLKG